MLRKCTRTHTCRASLQIMSKAIHREKKKIGTRFVGAAWVIWSRQKRSAVELDLPSTRAYLRGDFAAETSKRLIRASLLTSNYRHAMPSL